MFGVALGLDYPAVDAAKGIAASPLFQLAHQATDFSLRFTGARPPLALQNEVRTHLVPSGPRLEAYHACRSTRPFACEFSLSDFQLRLTCEVPHRTALKPTTKLVASAHRSHSTYQAVSALSAGFLNIPVAETNTYAIGLSCDDGAQLYIDGMLAVSCGGEVALP